VKLGVRLRPVARLGPFSILERIDVGETMGGGLFDSAVSVLSVSSNGSTWVKPKPQLPSIHHIFTFSILERIDVGETYVGEQRSKLKQAPFSILERIDVGETTTRTTRRRRRRRLSVSSNGSTWVKHVSPVMAVKHAISLSVSSNGSTWVKLVIASVHEPADFAFQYPRTDRRG